MCLDGSTPCADLADCHSTSDCAYGSVCVIGTCCQRNVCISESGCEGATLDPSISGFRIRGTKPRDGGDVDVELTVGGLLRH